MSEHPDSNTYQIAGLDDRSRGFNRQATVTFLNDHYQAIFLYEKFRMVAENEESETAAVHGLIRRLHETGYRELRSRLHFRGRDYLGNQELWEEHADPETQNLWHRLVMWMRRLRRKKGTPQQS